MDDKRSQIRLALPEPVRRSRIDLVARTGSVYEWAWRRHLPVRAFGQSSNAPLLRRFVCADALTTPEALLPVPRHEGQLQPVGERNVDRVGAAEAKRCSQLGRLLPQLVVDGEEVELRHLRDPRDGAPAEGWIPGPPGDGAGDFCQQKDGRGQLFAGRYQARLAW